MDLIAFGLVALGVAVLGLLVALVVGIRYAVTRSQERRYLARSARYSMAPPRSTR